MSVNQTHHFLKRKKYYLRGLLINVFLFQVSFLNNIPSQSQYVIHSIQCNRHWCNDIVYSIYTTLTQWQLNLCVIASTPFRVWTTPVCPSIAVFKLSDHDKNFFGGLIVLQSEPALTQHVSAIAAVISLAEELPAILASAWLRTGKSERIPHIAWYVLCLHTAPLCQAESADLY